MQDSANKRYYKINTDKLSDGLLQRLGVHTDLMSIGLDVKRDSLAQDILDTGRAVEVLHQEWNHSGCQSSCVLRGNPICRW